MLVHKLKRKSLKLKKHDKRQRNEMSQLKKGKMRRVNLKELRKGLGLTQQQVADKASISRPYYSMLENDLTDFKYSPKIDILRRLAKVLGFEWADYYKTVEQ